MDELRALMRDRNHFVVTGHMNPDGDAIGACYALGLTLAKMGKSVKVVLEDYADKYKIIPGAHLRYTGSLDTLEMGVLFCLDCSAPERLGAAQGLLTKTADTVCIDHHMTNTGFTRHQYIDGNVSSTSELIFRLVVSEVMIDQDIASAIYAGMVDDTGGFRYSVTSRETLDIAGQLMALGIPFTEIYTEMSHLRSFKEAKLFARAVEACERALDKRVVYSCVTRAMLDAFSASGKDLEGVVEYLLNIRGTEVSVLLYAKAGTEVKISMRSQHLDVSRIAVMLGGGGHAQAAGANVHGDIFEMKDKVLALLEQEWSADV